MATKRLTIDPETKDYIDKWYSNISIKASSFLAILCQELEQKGILQPGDFEKILLKAQDMAQFNMMLIKGKTDITSIGKMFEKAAKDFEKQALDRKGWTDLK